MAQRRTMQKDVIYSALSELRNHPTADQVYEYIHTSQPSISRATVYRVLHQLAANGKAEKIGVLSGADRFDHNLMPHSHAQCVECHRIFDINYIKPSILPLNSEENDGFIITDYTILFEGHCRDCRKENENVLPG